MSKVVVRTEQVFKLILSYDEAVFLKNFLEESLMKNGESNGSEIRKDIYNELERGIES